MFGSAVLHAYVRMCYVNVYQQFHRVGYAGCGHSGILPPMRVGCVGFQFLVMWTVKSYFLDCVNCLHSLKKISLVLPVTNTVQ